MSATNAVWKPFAETNVHGIENLHEISSVQIELPVEVPLKRLRTSDVTPSKPAGVAFRPISPLQFDDFDLYSEMALSRSSTVLIKNDRMHSRQMTCPDFPVESSLSRVAPGLKTYSEWISVLPGSLSTPGAVKISESKARGCGAFSDTWHGEMQYEGGWLRRQVCNGSNIEVNP